MAANGIDSLHRVIAGRDVLIAAQNALLRTKTVALESASTQVQALTDSLSAHAVQTASLQHRVDSLSTLLASGDHITQVHVIGWGVTLAGFIIAAVIAVLGWRANAQTALHSVERRREIEDKRSRTRLVLRIRGALENGIGRFDSMLKSDHTRPISADGMEIVRKAWERYEDVSDEIALLEDPALEDDVETTLLAMGGLAERVLREEEQFRSTRRELGKVTPTGIEVDRSVEKGIQDHRVKLLAMIAKINEACKRSLDAFDKSNPPRRGHEAPHVPEPGSDLPASSD